jgi:hypothetical protein
MRLVVWLVVVLVACKDTSPKSAPTAADWKPIEALAVTPPSPGDSTHLLRALELAKQHGTAWREYKEGDDVSAFLGAADAVAALKAWADAKGALPPIESPMQLGVVTMSMSRLALISMAVAKTPAELEGVEYLAGKLVTDGRDLLEVQMGTSLVRDAAAKRKQMGAPAVAMPKLDLVRVLAAEALQTRAVIGFAATPAGKKELEAAAKEMADHERDVGPLTVRSDAAQLTALNAFWLAALHGAQRGEPMETTLARLRSAVDSAPAAIKDEVAIIPRAVESIVESANEPRE